MRKKDVLIILFIFLIGIQAGCEKANKKGSKTETNDTEEVNKSTGKAESFFAYHGDVYYWKISENSREDIGLNGYYKEKSGVKNKLVKADKNNNEDVILEDAGSKEIIISNNKIYTSYTTDDNESARSIYSVDLKDRSKKEIGKGFIKYLVNGNIIGVTEDGSEIFFINTYNDEYEIIKEKSDLIGIIDDSIYYGDKSSDKEYKVGIINGDNDYENIVSVDKSDFGHEITKTLSVESFTTKDDKLVMYIGYRNGSQDFIQELVRVTMNKDGKDVEKEKVTLEDTKKFSSYKKDKDDGNVVAYDSKTNQEIKLLTYQEISEQFHLLMDEEHYLTLYKGTVIGEDFYFIIDYGVHEKTNDIGWRYAYKREKTLYCKYDVSTKELIKIYEF